MSPLLIHLGTTVKAVRAQRGWSQEKLAELAGLDRSYVGQIERAVVSPSLSTLEKLADALQLAPSELISMNGFGMHPKKSVIDGDHP